MEEKSWALIACRFRKFIHNPSMIHLRVVCLLASICTTFAVSNVTVVRTPDGGIQPQAAVDAEGTAHLIYYKGDERAGDVFYVRQKVGDKNFSMPIKVNSRPGSAMAAG